MKRSKKLNKMTLFSVVILIIVFLVIYLLGMNQGAKSSEKNIESLPLASNVKQEELIFAFNPYTKQAETQAYKIDTSYTLFSEDEVENFRTNVAQPYFDYHNENDIQVVSVIFKKPGISLKAIYINGGTDEHAEIYTYKNKAYWYPSCMGECPFTEVFKRNHPNIVELSKCFYQSEASICLEEFMNK